MDSIEMISTLICSRESRLAFCQRAVLVQRREVGWAWSRSCDEMFITKGETSVGSEANIGWTQEAFERIG